MRSVGVTTQTLLHKPLPFYGFVFVFLSYSAYSSSSSPSFLFCSLAGFHLECTSNSLGATSLWPAGLPNGKKIYITNRNVHCTYTSSQISTGSSHPTHVSACSSLSPHFLGKFGVLLRFWKSLLELPPCQRDAK